MELRALRAAATRVGVLLLLSGLSALPAFGMEFGLTSKNPFGGAGDGTPYWFLMRGEIRSGDYDRLLKLVVSHDISLPGHEVVLSSPGGDVAEALKIGRLVKRLYLSVSVGPTFGPCVSACFLIFASAVNRTAVAGLVGIHRPYANTQVVRGLTPAETEIIETRALGDAEQYLHELGVPRHFIDAMFERASTEVHWMNDQELRQLGRRLPWYEEFLIARCDLDKAEDDQLLVDYDNPRISKKARQHWHSVLKCAQNLTQPEVMANFSKAIEPYGGQLESPLTDAPGPDAVAVCDISPNGQMIPCASNNVPKVKGSH